MNNYIEKKKIFRYYKDERKIIFNKNGGFEMRTQREILENIKEKISLLSDDDQKIYNNYLKKMSLDNMSGYPTKDKPWNQFFDLSKLKSEKETVYQSILKNNKDYIDNLAILFFGSKIKFKELFAKIDKTSKALCEYGVKKGDFVTVCCAGIPELVYTFYALAKIGAVANLMAPYFNQSDMADRINDCESNILIVMDQFYPQIKESIKKSSIKKVIVIPTLNSSVLKYLPNKNKVKLNYKNELYWNQFVKDGELHILPETFDYQKDYPLCTVYSSGTTGASKAIVLSHDSFQNSVLSYKANSLNIQREHKMYQIIPPWYSTGLNSCIHLPLYFGLSVFQDPRFQREVFVKNIIKNKLDFIIAPTSMYEGFLDENLVKNKKLKGLKFPFEGGEVLRNDTKEKIEKSFQNMGCDAKLRVGYGQCECGAQIATQSQNVNHPSGSVGLPIPGVTIGIFDDNFNELPYFQRGNILVNTPCGMLEYYKNPKATSEYFHIDKNGIRWSCTGDVGYISITGDLFVEGRSEDYTIINNEKIYNFDIEKVIAKEEDIKNCDVIGKQNQDGTIELGAHIIFKEEAKQKYLNDNVSLTELLMKIQKEVMEQYQNINMVPKYFKIRDDFPYKPSGKRDIEALKNETTGFIFMDNSYMLSNYKRVLMK